jgi:hypothetical protein
MHAVHEKVMPPNRRLVGSNHVPGDNQNRTSQDPPQRIRKTSEESLRESASKPDVE